VPMLRAVTFTMTPTSFSELGGLTGRDGGDCSGCFDRARRKTFAETDIFAWLWVTFGTVQWWLCGIWPRTLRAQRTA
jgi:hypothetical protein